MINCLKRLETYLDSGGMIFQENVHPSKNLVVYLTFHI